MNILHTVSIIFELIVVLLGFLLAVQKKKVWGWFLMLTFAIYVYYDLSGLVSLTISQDLLRGLFFIASLSILWVVWSIYREA